MSDVQDTKRQPETFVMVEGNPVPNSLEPAGQTHFQRAYKMKQTKDGPRIVIAIEPARKIAQDRIRAERKAAFAKNDDEIKVAQRRGLDLAPLHAKADKLADAPADPRLADAKTIEALDAAIDAIIAEF